MKRIALLAIVLLVAYLNTGRTPPLPQPAEAPGAPATQAPAEVRATAPSSQGAAIGEQRSGSPITGEGRVSKLLADDNDGSRHQRFIVTLSSGQTLLIAHNIDLAPRINALQTGDSISFKGQYESNSKGGVVHWTHRDPAGRHEPGWLQHAGQTYQ